MRFRCVRAEGGSNCSEGSSCRSTGPCSKAEVKVPAPQNKKTASKPQAAKLGTGELTDESNGDKEEESEEEAEEEPQVSQGKTEKKAAAKPRAEGTGARAPFKEPARQFQPRDQPKSNCQRIRCPLLSLWVLRCKLFRRNSNFFLCSDTLCARGQAMHSSSTTFLLSPSAARFSL